MSFCQVMNEFWKTDLGTVLTVVHNPSTHHYEAGNWQSQNLLAGIIAKTYYEERYHGQILAKALEYGLEVRCLESTDSMLAVIVNHSNQLRQRDNSQPREP